MKNLAFHSLLRWMMIILPFLTTSLVIKRLGECTFWTWEWKAAVVLTQMSAYSMHKNLAVRKVMEAMHTAYVKKRDSASTGLKNMMQTIMEHYTRHVKGKRASFAFILLSRLMKLVVKCAFEMRHSFLYFFSLVCISEFDTNLTQISHPVVYHVRISSKASATAGKGNTFTPKSDQFQTPPVASSEI